MKPQPVIAESNNRYPNTLKNSLQKSPKVSTNKFRNEEYFSLLDVNINQVSRGTKMPVQYMRHTDSQMKQITTNPPIKVCLQNEENKKDNNDVNQKERKIKSAYLISRIDRVLGYKFNNDLLQADANMNQRDTNMPKGYSLYERQVKTEANVNNVDPNSTKRSYIKIKDKGINSNIFSKKDDSDLKAPSTTHIREYKTHDIFNNKLIKTDQAPIRIPYSSIKESESAWLPTFVSPTYYNHCTTEHNLINPAAKNTSLTRSQVKTTNKILNPSHRQKGFCEYIDLTRVTAPNINKDYVSYNNRPKSSFGKSRELCTNYYDSFNGYKDLCDKPFKTKKQ